MHMHHDHLHRRQGGSALSNFENDVHNILSGGQSPGQNQGQQFDQSDNQNSDPNANGGGGSGDGSGGAATLVSIVFITASKDFNGPIKGWSTVAQPTPAPQQTPQQQQSQQQAAPTQQPQGAAPTSVVNNQPPPTDTPASSQQQVDPSTSSKHHQSLLNSIQVTSNTGLSTPTANSSPSGALVGAAASGTSSGQPSASGSAQDTGLSGGAKAGIAIGVILGLLALLAAGFAVYRHKKNSQEREEEVRMNEKNPFADAAAASPPPPPSQPRLTTPISQGPSSFGAIDAIGATRAPAHPEMQAANPANPFGNHAETLATAPKPYAPSMPAPSIPAPPSEAEKAALAVGGAAMIGGAAAAAAAAHHHQGPQALDVKAAQSPAAYSFAGAASPAGSQFSTSSVTSAAVAAGATPTNVHRVQLDFKPSMDDELELKAGQLIRLLHEYDDGWALCMRLDRTQQGVAPRTCLSTRSVKPRNGGPPNGGPPRGGPPPPGMRGPSSRTGSPAPRSPAGPPMMSADPTKRSMSPGPYGGGPQQNGPQRPDQRQRSNSASNIEPRRMNVPGPSPMNPAYARSPPQAPAPFMQPSELQMELPVEVPRPLTPSSPASRSTTPPSAGVQRKPVPGKQSL